MSYIVPLVAVTIFVCGLLFFRIQKLPFFEPIFREDFPEELKPFFRMNRCKYRATANPRHKLLPELKKIVKESDAKNVNVDIIAHKFAYEGYTPTDKWYTTLVEILKKGGGINLIGGYPSEDKLECLRELKELGANVRFLTGSPISHLFVYSRESDPTFIWFEKEHKDEIATCVAYTRYPNAKDAELAKEYFGNVWRDGIPMENPQV